jgi:hypothetical protein
MEPGKPLAIMNDIRRAKMPDKKETIIELTEEQKTQLKNATGSEHQAIKFESVTPGVAKLAPKTAMKGKLSPKAPLKGKLSPKAPLKGKLSPKAPLKGKLSPKAPLKGKLSPKFNAKGKV